MTMNVRPKGNPDAPLYSPHRDLAHIGPDLLRLAGRLCDSNTYGNEFADDLAKVGVTEEDFGAVALAAARATRMFMMTPVIAEPNQALAECGFFDTPKLANRLFFAGFGELCFVSMLRGIRELGRLNEDSPQQQDVAAFLAHVTQYIKHRGYELTPELDTDAADVISMRMTIEHQTKMIEALNQRIDELLLPLPTSEVPTDGEETHLATP